MTIKKSVIPPKEVEKKKPARARKPSTGRKPEKKKPLKSSGRGKALSKEGVIMALIPYFQMGLSIERAVDAHNASVKKTLAKMANGDTLNNSDTDKLGVIASQTVRTWYDKDKQVRYWIDGARDSMKLLARNVVIKSLQNNNVETARWVLETQEKAEFSKRIENTGTDGAPLFTSITIKESDE